MVLLCETTHVEIPRYVITLGIVVSLAYPTCIRLNMINIGSGLHTTSLLHAGGYMLVTVKFGPVPGPSPGPGPTNHLALGLAEEGRGSQSRAMQSRVHSQGSRGGAQKAQAGLGLAASC